MRAQRSGTIVNISSVGGKAYTPLGAWYHATKHALEGFSDVLRFETEPFGIRTVVIEPGGVESQWGEIALASARKYSGDTSYAPILAGWQRATALKGAPPSVISNLVVRALRAKRPKTRYSAGTAAKLSLFLRAVLSDRMFDRFLRAAFRVPRAEHVISPMIDNRVGAEPRCK
jgi:NAD(P)-dependent dehydrogenase (short-subunit alcohol dehydrogenase family)